MSSPENCNADPQEALNAYFREETSYWAEIYEGTGIAEAIHQDRLRAALDMVDSLGLSVGANALDVGCGTGLATVGLARRGFVVEALDSVETMIEATRNRAQQAGEQSRVTLRIGDIGALPFPDQTFEFVLALGVLPWLPDINRPLQEMSRVVRPAGHVIASIDARWQLRFFFDPLVTPLLEGPRKLAASIVGQRRRPHRGAPSYITALRDFRRALASAGLEPVRGIALGFGPFTIFEKEILHPAAGLKLNNWLQTLANRGAPIFRSTGSQYMVLAKKLNVRN